MRSSAWTVFRQSTWNKYMIISQKSSTIESSTVGEHYHLPLQWIAPACKCITSPWKGSPEAAGGGTVVVLRSCLRLGGCCVDFHKRGVLGGILTQFPVHNVVMAIEKSNSISKTSCNSTQHRSSLTRQQGKEKARSTIMRAGRVRGVKMEWGSTFLPSLHAMPLLYRGTD